MIYLEKFKIISDDNAPSELFNLYTEDEWYPFGLFFHKQLTQLDFEPITILYGGNGCGKSTLLNVIAEKLSLQRYTQISKTVGFDIFVGGCEYKLGTDPDSNRKCEIKNSKVLTSDDIFKNLIQTRIQNNEIKIQKEDDWQQYQELNSGCSQYRNMEDYDKLKLTVQARTSSRRKFIRDRVGMRKRQFSNGENALKFFDSEIKQDSLYLLDEPENSMSPSFQIQLKKLIEDCTNFFGCQFIIATHSPFILSLKGAKIYNLDEEPATIARWTELENTKAYYSFFKAHEKEFE